MTTENKNYKKTNRAYTKATRDYGYYSKVLKKPFDSIEELRLAEAEYTAQVKAKEDKAATKKADALKVEESFKALNQARKDYKDNLLKLTSMYQEDLQKLKSGFESDKARVEAALSDAENTYAATLKNFTDKYPEGYHITLKDGDFETTISSKTETVKDSVDTKRVAELLNWLFH
jgi:chromosome segregation ATPase